MTLFNPPKKFMISSEYVDINIDGQPLRLDKQLLECVKYNAKMDIPDHAPVFDIVGLATRITNMGFSADIVTIDYGDLLVTYEIAEDNGEYKPFRFRWQNINKGK